MTTEWDSQNVALEMRDVIAAIADTRIEVLRPTPSYAVVQTINRELRSATVLHVGDTQAVTVAMASIEPADVGQTVRIGGLIGHRYIEDVLGDAVVSGMHPAEMGARIAPYAADARFGHALGAGVNGFIATSYGDMSISTAPGRGVYIATDGYGTYAFFRPAESYIYPWTLSNSTGVHAGPTLMPYGADPTGGYTLLVQGSNTYLNSPSGGLLNLRVGNSALIQLSFTTTSIFNTLSTNAIVATSIAAGSVSTGSGQVSCGNLVATGVNVGAGGVTCGGLNTQGGDLSAGNIYGAGLGLSAHISCTHIDSYSRIQSHTSVQADWTSWGLLSQGTSGIGVVGMHNGTYAAGWRLHVGNGDMIVAVNYNAGSYVNVYCEDMIENSTITGKKDVRSLRPERERSVVHHDPVADDVGELDIMALRPVAFRRKNLMRRINSDTGEGEVVPADEVLGRQSRRERVGLIAEEVQHVIPSAVFRDADGITMGINYSQITVALLDHTQRLTDEIATLRYRISELEGDKS